MEQASRPPPLPTKTKQRCLKKCLNSVKIIDKNNKILNNSFTSDEKKSENWKFGEKFKGDNQVEISKSVIENRKNVSKIVRTIPIVSKIDKHSSNNPEYCPESASAKKPQICKNNRNTSLKNRNTKRSSKASVEDDAKLFKYSDPNICVGSRNCIETSLSSTDLKIIDNTTKPSDDMKNVDVASGAPKIFPLFHCESFSEIDDEQAKLCESLLKCHEIFPPDEQSLSFFGDRNILGNVKKTTCSKSNSNSLTIEKSFDRCTKRFKSLSNSVDIDVFKNLKSKTQLSKTRKKIVKNVCSKSTGISDAAYKTTIAASVEQLTTEAIACNTEPNVMRSKNRVSHCRKSMDIVGKNVEALVNNTISVNKFNRFPSKNDALGRYKSSSVAGDKNTTPLGCASC